MILERPDQGFYVDLQKHKCLIREPLLRHFEGGTTEKSQQKLPSKISPVVEMT